MKLLSSCFHFQGSWLEPSVSGGQRLSMRRFLWVFVQSSPTSPATAPRRPARRRARGEKTAFSPCQRNPAPLWPGLQTVWICASRAVAWAPQENFSYIQSSNWTQASQAKTRLTVGTTGCCQREQPPWEARTAKLNNRRLVPRPPPQERQPSHRSPWGRDRGALLVSARLAKGRGTPSTAGSAGAKALGFDSPQRCVMLKRAWLHVL